MKPFNANAVISARRFVIIVCTKTLIKDAKKNLTPSR